MYRSKSFRRQGTSRTIGVLVILCGVVLLIVILLRCLAAASTPVTVKGTILQMDEKSIEVIVNPIGNYEPGEKITAQITANTQIMDSGRLVTQNSLKIGMYVSLTLQTSGASGSVTYALKVEILR